MLEFNLFLIDYWYFSVPLFFFLFLFAYSEMNKGGKKIEPNELTRLVNKENAILIDLRKKEDFENLPDFNYDPFKISNQSGFHTINFQEDSE